MSSPRLTRGICITLEQKAINTSETAIAIGELSRRIREHDGAWKVEGGGGEGGERRAFSVTCRGGRKQAAGARSSARANGEEERLGSCQLAGACGGGGGDGVAARRGASKTHARTRRRRRDRTLPRFTFATPRRRGCDNKHQPRTTATTRTIADHD